MKVRLLVVAGALALVVALAVPVIAYVSMTPAPVPAVKFSTVLGTPGDHSPDGRLPTLAMDIVFDDKHNRIVSRQENGDVVLWGLKDSSPEVIAYTDSLFGYCRNRSALIIAKEDRVSILNLARDPQPTPLGARRLTTGAFDHVVWDGNCSRFALASQASRTVDVWSAMLSVREVTIKTAMPVRNGLAISDNGRFVAAAQGAYSDDDGHRTRLDVFEVAANLDVTPSTALDDSTVVAGMWKMVFPPRSTTLVAGSQTEARSGLIGLAATTGDPGWRQDGFDSYWVRGVAASPDGKLLATGDENGLLRLWNVDDGSKVFEASTGLVIQSLSFSSDGTRLAVALWDSTIAIVDVADLVLNKP